MRHMPHAAIFNPADPWSIHRPRDSDCSTEHELRNANSNLPAPAQQLGGRSKRDWKIGGSISRLRSCSRKNDLHGDCELRKSRDRFRDLEDAAHAACDARRIQLVENGVRANRATPRESKSQLRTKTSSVS